jgi:hypothetical protein
MDDLSPLDDSPKHRPTRVFARLRSEKRAAPADAPWLSPIAALGLATIMLLAVLYHLRRHEPPAVPAGLFLFAFFVTVGRFSRWG